MAVASDLGASKTDLEVIVRRFFKSRNLFLAQMLGYFELMPYIHWNDRYLGIGSMCVCYVLYPV
jgi:hypothetical protein